MQCSFCNDPAVGIWYLDEGCIGFVTKRQALCLQHLRSVEPLNNIELIEDLTMDKIFSQDCAIIKEPDDCSDR